MTLLLSKCIKAGRSDQSAAQICSLGRLCQFIYLSAICNFEIHKLCMRFMMAYVHCFLHEIYILQEIFVNTPVVEGKSTEAKSNVDF